MCEALLSLLSVLVSLSVILYVHNGGAYVISALILVLLYVLVTLYVLVAYVIV